MVPAGKVDMAERGIRGVLAIGLFLLAWGYGWTGVIPIGAMVLGAYALVTALSGRCPLAALCRPAQAPRPKGGVVGFIGHPRLALVWLAARLWLGWIWLDAGWHKLRDSAWVGDEAPAAINGFLTNATSPESTGGPFPAVSSWYAWLVENVFLPGDALLTYLVPIGQFAIGIALILGMFTALAAFFGAFMNLNFMLAGALGGGENPIMFGLSLSIVFVGSAAYVYGIDRFMIPALRRGWRAHHPHVRDDQPTITAY